ncbi:MAG: hypothetical protein H6709_13890 [Kofleriaceae bacterium]|nr:hypothetical protein [Myxococcales bacterium]MCB9565268.1 hypothetical protein [Kofleriaceae bacterium]MCB9573171.1 hypothetical protein [Kofleriaceae bacterium]
MWDHRPTADELLAARVAAGWRPTPTSTTDGDLVLGHACKLPTVRRDGAD